MIPANQEGWWGRERERRWRRKGWKKEEKERKREVENFLKYWGISVFKEEMKKE